LEFDNMARHHCGGGAGERRQTGVGMKMRRRARRQVRRCAKVSTRRVDYEGRGDGDVEGVWVL
jgi:hypothetical protein